MQFSITKLNQFPRQALCTHKSIKLPLLTIALILGQWVTSLMDIWTLAILFSEIKKYLLVNELPFFQIFKQNSLFFQQRANIFIQAVPVNIQLLNEIIKQVLYTSIAIMQTINLFYSNYTNFMLKQYYINQNVFQ